jgi:hypothetical protein
MFQNCPIFIRNLTAHTADLSFHAHAHAHAPLHPQRALPAPPSPPAAAATAAAPGGAGKANPPPQPRRRQAVQFQLDVFGFSSWPLHELWRRICIGSGCGAAGAARFHFAARRSQQHLSAVAAELPRRQPAGRHAHPGHRGHRDLQPRASLSLRTDIHKSVLNNSCDRAYL